MSFLVEKISELLAHENTDLAKVCLNLLSEGSPGVTSLEIPLKNARYIYSRRAELNTDRGTPIPGLDELAKKLDCENIPSVGIHAVEVGVNAFDLFTTPDMARLIGIVLIKSHGKPETN